jgi:hypothetical protein
MARLRRKDGPGLVLLHTVRGAGYTLIPVGARREVSARRHPRAARRPLLAGAVLLALGASRSWRLDGQFRRDFDDQPHTGMSAHLRARPP